MAAFGATGVGKTHHVTRTCRQYLYHPAEIRREANVWPFTRALIDVGARTKKRGCKKKQCAVHISPTWGSPSLAKGHTTQDAEQ